MIIAGELPEDLLMNYLLYFCFSILLTTVMVPAFIKIGKYFGIVDKPGLRKVHVLPIPRTGGLAVLIGGLVPFILLVKNSRLLIGICLGVICLLMIGIIDDIRDLSCRWKFLGQILAAALTLLVCNIGLNTTLELWQGITVDLRLLAFPISLFFLLATTNIINLADGLDGLAGGICLLIFFSSGIFAYFREEFYTIALCICMIGAIIGFLRYNTFPAIVFLGDTGSLFLGFCVGVCMMLLTRGNTIYSPVICLYIIGVPIFDTAMVIIERLIDGRPVFKADKNHIHHKLLKMGFKHNEAVIIIYAMQMLMSLLAWNLRFFTGGALLGIYLFLLCSVSTFFLFYKNGYLCFSYIHNRPPNYVDLKTMSAQGGFFSKNTASLFAWCGLVGGMLLFCLFTPFVVYSVSWDIGLICLILIVCILALRRFNSRFLKTATKFSAYFISLFYIYSLEGQAGMFLVTYNILFIGMGICYLFYLISSLEKIPLFSMDYLLLAVVLLASFIPKTHPWFIHLNHIAVRALFIFFFIELLFYRIKGKKFDYMRWSIFFALGVTCVTGFLFI